MRAAPLAVALSCLAAAAPASCQVPSPTGEIVWHRNTACPAFENVWGCAYPPDSQGVIHIYIDPSVPHEALDDVEWHEAAHAYDFTIMQDNARAAWLRINRPRDNVQTWWDGFNPPAEQFAESYRLCALGRAAMPYRNYNYTPTRRQLRATCRLMRSM